MAAPVDYDPQALPAPLPPSAAEVIRRLNLTPLEYEGGSFVRTYEHIGFQFPGRRLASAIFYLLSGSERSAWHRVRGADELWFAHGPSPAFQMIVAPDGARWETRLLHPLPVAGGLPQAIVPADYWQSTRLLEAGPDCWSLFSAAVIPEFRPCDFEAQTAAGLCRLNPQLAAAIREFEAFTVPADAFPAGRR